MLSFFLSMIILAIHNGYALLDNNDNHKISSLCWPMSQAN